MGQSSLRHCNALMIYKRSRLEGRGAVGFRRNLCRVSSSGESSKTLALTGWRLWQRDCAACKKMDCTACKKKDCAACKKKGLCGMQKKGLCRMQNKGLYRMQKKRFVPHAKKKDCAACKKNDCVACKKKIAPHAKKRFCRMHHFSKRSWAVAHTQTPWLGRILNGGVEAHGGHTGFLQKSGGSLQTTTWTFQRSTPMYN